MAAFFLYQYSFKQKLFNKMSNSKINFSGLPKAILLASVAGVILNVVLFYIGAATGIMDPAVGVPNADGTIQYITVVPVIISSILPVVVAAGVLALFNRFTPDPMRTFGRSALVLCVLSFANPFLAIPNVPIAMGVWLNVMHVVVAGSVWYFFSRLPQQG
jgi:hypothetical protein